MKRYKLIAEYPGSPKLGYITKFNEHGEDWKAPKCVVESDCTNYPEFWEEVKEKDYEVLTMKGSKKEGDILYRVNDDGTVNPWGNPMKSVEDALNHGYTIYSIKRISDEEVFTIGDPVMLNASWTSGDTFISKITLNENNEIVFRIRQGKYESSYPKAHLEEWTKTNTILFRTEDGVDIKLGDSYFVVENVLLLPMPSTNIREFSCNDSSVYLNFVNKPYFKIFSTKEAAEEYVIMNKPCLSLKDVLESYKFFYYTGHPDKYLNQTATLIELRKLIKERI